MNGINVWEVHKKIVTYHVSGTFLIPDYITSVYICGVGGGGGGSASVANGGTGMGGASGAIRSGVQYAVVPGTTVVVDVGAGGAIGVAGGDSRFDALSMDGGLHSAYAGNGNRRDTCGGSYHDGNAVGSDFGGQASIRADGGQALGGIGKYGSGGGADGVGGSGLVIISYYQEEQE